MNGVHLNERGNQLLARGIYKALFGTAAPADGKSIEELRATVLDKTGIGIIAIVQPMVMTSGVHAPNY